MQKKTKSIQKMVMFFALSIFFNGCSLVNIPQHITIPLLGEYYKQKTVIKKRYIKTKQRKIYKLPHVPDYTLRNVVEDGEYRVSISNIELYKAQRNCALKTKRLKQYEYMVTYNE